MASYSSRIRTDSKRWVELGFIDHVARKAIVEDAQAHDRRALSFGSILAIMAALLLSAAILIFVAANWEAFPRIGRVIMLFAVIAVSYLGGAVLKLRDHEAFGEALWLVGAATFGGSIALIGQMYHLSGDETQAILIWTVGTAVAAACLRSGPLTMAAVALASTWLFFVGISFWRNAPFPHEFVALAAVLWAISYWTKSSGARHLLLLSLVFYGALLAVETDVLRVAPVIAAVAAMLFALAVAQRDAVERVVQLNGLLPVHCLIGFLLGMWMTQFELANTAGSGFTIASAVALAGIVAAVVLAGRESRGLRWIAYTGFAIELCIIYGIMVQGMLGTAGFFFAASIVLGCLAFAIIRIEKRLSSQHQAERATA